jgi:hypothetical protein
MTEDLNLYAYAERRERELKHQISALKGQLTLIQGEIAQRENELGQITHIRASQTIAGGGIANRLSLGQALLGSAELAHGVVPQSGPREGVANRPLGVMPSPGPYPLEHQSLQTSINERFKQMTIKELVIQALLDHFPTGASAAPLRDFIKDAYGRLIAPSSLRPQLHRLQAAEILYHDPSSDLWNITSQWRAKCIQYNAPFSGVGVHELESDESPEPKGTGDSEEDDVLLKLAAEFAWRDKDDSKPK